MRKVVLRRCLVTGERLPKKQLIRIVRTPEGEIKIDPTGKLNGHGGYLSIDEAVFKRAKKDKVLEKKFGTVPTNIYDELMEYLKSVK